ncbi:hypothetical protein ACHHYP_12673 [Achlya hypogyna]|uniref:Uncharacterized protein n=1 Tax=Achlya hypogyna TaxID=1202772 RepID=A0A1V9ZGL1_ACHHY|nr:hypothetical protein ACHHYP_12673 [Achlya hypogyna]
MGNRFSWRRKKKVKVEEPAPVEVPAEAEPPPPEVVLPEDDGSSFWASAFGMKAGQTKEAIPPLDVSGVQRRDPNALTAEDLRGVAEVCAELEERIESATSGDADLHFNLGLTYFAVGRRADACTQFKAALSVDATFGRAYTHLAHMLLQEGNPSPALLREVVGYLELSLVHDPSELRENKILLAEVYCLLGDQPNALRMYSLVDRVDDEWQNTFHRATCHWELQQYSESLALLEALAGTAGGDLPNQAVVLADVRGLVRGPAVVAAS